MKFNQFLTLLLMFLLLGITSAQAQNNKKDQLEARRIELRNEIKKINSLLFSNQNKKKDQTALIEDLNYKLSVTNNLIKVTNQQANLLTRSINNNQKEISQLRDELTILKENYAKTIQKSYKNKSEQSRVMFLLSSDNFRQAYKRLQYMNQYAKVQKQQAEDIKVKAKRLQDLNLDLVKQKEEKDKLIAENKVIQNQLETDRKQHQSIMAEIKKDLNKYASQIKEKQREAAKIDEEIDRIIKAEIAKSNKKAGKTSTYESGFSLTAEAKLVAADFLNNKGKLPWPVEKGIVKLRYGKQRSPINPSVEIQSSGVRIATEKDAKVRAVFKGKVLAVMVQKKSNPVVLIQHGNYITAYGNLKTVYVKKGEEISTKQDIGEVFTDSDGQTLLKFSVYKNNASQNPAEWVYKM
ncbi:MAG: peptidoglycan DD-metalloendopeptidase family protein [Flavobacteriaceae bacterium]|nr:peptidoglycan DD-metalloendopeptidase family protein [Flavobacteriaceae bacterium]